MPRTENETKPRQFRLAADTMALLDLIAAHLSAQTGTTQSRAAAIRYAARDVAARLGKKSQKKP